MTIYHGDALETLNTFDNESIDSIITDPPYGYSFMNKDWDKAVIGVETWKECLRVLKPGSFAAIMSSPRQDVLARMVCNLQDAGFRTDFTSIYWTYASGFPKAANISKLVDKRAEVNKDFIEQRKKCQIYIRQKLYERYKHHDILANELGVAESLIRHWIGKCGDQDLLPTWKFYIILKEKLGLNDEYDSIIEERPKEWIEAEREIVGQMKKARSEGQHSAALPTLGRKTKYIDINITKSSTDRAKELDGSYAGFQPKPALEVVLIVMKPLSEKTFVDQALKNGKGISWLDDGRISFQDDKDIESAKYGAKTGIHSFIQNYLKHGYRTNSEADYVKKVLTQEINSINSKGRFPANLLVSDSVLKDHSRYFDLDKWFDTTFPFIITPKASSTERNKGLEKWMDQTVTDGRIKDVDNPFQRGLTPRKNIHPTCKPIKLMSYLISLFSREGDVILDPFCGSGTTLIAVKMLNRNPIGIEINKEYIEIANQRLSSTIINHQLP